MQQAHKLDCETATADCRFVVQSEDVDEAVELARRHLRNVHGQDYTGDTLRRDHLQIV